MALKDFTVESLVGAYRKGDLSPVEMAESLLGEIEKEAKLNAFLQVRSDALKARAEELVSKKKDLANLPLYGVPIGIKDNFLVKGWQATAASRILEGYTSPYTATCVERLEAAGAMVVGKTNLDEFAMGSSNENSAFGAVKNPWDETRVPGGSSGGSAAAVAADLCLASLGTDTGGSVRQPASLCGVVGLKPTYGRVSRYGVIAFASSLDQVSPFAHSVADISKVLEVISGYDRRDATSSRAIVPRYSDHLKGATAKGVKIGVAKEWKSLQIDSEVSKSVEQALEQMKENGAELVEISLPHIKYSLSTYYLLATSEASSNLARYDGVHAGHRSSSAKNAEDVYFKSRGEGFGAEAKLRIMLGTYALSAGYFDAFYGKANAVRERIQRDFLEAFEKCDCIAMPTSPDTAFKIAEKTDDPIKMYSSDICTLPASLSGLPAISVPCGLDPNKLPIGVQFVGKHFEESHLLKVAAAYEAIRGEFPRARGN